MGKRTKVIAVGVLMIILCAGYFTYGETDEAVLLNLLYEDHNNVPYKVTNNKMIDTYIIASALYMDFNSNVIMPNTDSYSIYKKTKEHFQPFKNHDFIKEFNKYTFNSDINGDAIGVLLSYGDTSELNKLCEVDMKYRDYIFKDDKEIEKFIEGLRRFYIDTNAEKFFEENTKLLSISKNYLSNTIQDSKLVTLIKDMEEYLNTNNYIYNSKPVDYETVITFFRPTYASFYSISTGDNNRLITFQSLSDYTGDPYKLDINNMVENTIHELLHSYINKEVKYVIENRNILTTDKIALTNNRMYNNMPLNRQADEYLVRAIEGRLYKTAFGEEYTFYKLLNKEINFGGFDELQKYYNYLESYEMQRDNYEDITEFLPLIIEDLMKNNTILND